MTSFLLATSNGTGMGHLTRQAAVALALGREHDATIFSLSVGLPLIETLGLNAEYCMSYDLPWLASRNWHSYLADRLVAIIEETGSRAVLFDGVAPYSGLARAAARLPAVAFVWLRRGMWMETNQPALRKGAFFDLVVEPGDLARSADHGPTSRLTDAVRVGPISIVEPLGSVDRLEARRVLGLPPDGPIALVTLGSGRLGDVAGPGMIAVDAILRAAGGWHVAVTRSAVSLNHIPVGVAGRVTELTGVYPLARYLPAFDLAVSSAGYNAVHELIPAGLPTILVANTSTKTDDQGARARYLEGSGLALAVLDDDLGEFEPKLTTLFDNDTRLGLASRASETAEMMTGAAETGQTLAAFVDDFKGRRRITRVVLAEQERRAKDLAKAALGDERVQRLKTTMGRAPTPVHEKNQVRIVDRVGYEPRGSAIDLALLRTVTMEDLRSGQPVEHVIANGSEHYLDERRRIIQRYYDVTESSSA